MLPERPSCIASASARAMFDSAGWMKMPSGLDLDRGRVPVAEVTDSRATKVEAGEDEGSGCAEERYGSEETASRSRV